MAAIPDTYCHHLTQIHKLPCEPFHIRTLEPYESSFRTLQFCATVCARLARPSVSVLMSAIVFRMATGNLSLGTH